MTAKTAGLLQNEAWKMCVKSALRYLLASISFYGVNKKKVNRSV